MIGQGLGDTGGLPDQRSAAVATDDMIGFYRAPATAVALGDHDLRALPVLRDLFGAPAITGLDHRQLADATAQHGFGLVLRQPFVVGEVKWTHQFALHPIVVIAAEQRAIGGDAADAIVARDGPRRAQRLLRAPEMEM